MKNLTIIPALACIVIAGSITSCKKSSSTPAPSTPATTTSSPTISVGSGVSGTLVSLKTDVVTVAAGMPFSVTTESGLATFFTSAGATSSFTDAGTVSVNSTQLDQQSNKSYLKTASIGMTPSTLNFSSNNSNWNVAGAFGSGL